MTKYKTTAFDLKLALLQYFRFRRQCICVEEWNGADIIVDTGKEIIEVEVKLTITDLIHGEKKKAFKHRIYKNVTSIYKKRVPNKFLLCMPEKFVQMALSFCRENNSDYGVIAFDTERFENCVNDSPEVYHGAYIRIAKSAKKLHEYYDDDLRWSIAKRVSARIVTLKQKNFERRIKCDDTKE